MRVHFSSGKVVIGSFLNPKGQPDRTGEQAMAQIDQLIADPRFQAFVDQDREVTIRRVGELHYDLWVQDKNKFLSRETGLLIKLSEPKAYQAIAATLAGLFGIIPHQQPEIEIIHLPFDPGASKASETELQLSQTDEPSLGARIHEMFGLRVNPFRAITTP